MKQFPEMWEAAKSLGADLEDLAEEFYNGFKDKITEQEMEKYLNLIAQIDNYQKYLDEIKAEKDDITRLNIKLKSHKHHEDQVVLPME